MGWEGQPSPATLIPLALKYTATLLVSLVLFRNFYLAFFWLLIGSIHVGLRYFALIRTSYRLSSQRLQVTEGMFSQTTTPYELFRLGEGLIKTPFHLSFFKVSNLYLGNGPVLLGITNAEAVRDMIREFGFTEGARLDKVRWRD